MIMVRYILIYNSRSLLLHSTNIAKGWHRGFNSMLGCSTSKPTIWKLLDCVKAEHSLNNMKKTKETMKESPEERAARWINYDRRIQDYQNYANRINFLKAIGNLTMRLLNLKNDDRSKLGLQSACGLIT